MPRRHSSWIEACLSLAALAMPAAGAGDIGTAELPDEFVVDYVRVYDLVDRESVSPTVER